jgi:low affinity Fe/Cu permease
MYRASPFSRFARWIAHAAGHPAAFVIAVVVVLGWLLAGPVFRFTDTWQLVINTSTTIVTFLMVFLIQNTQNHDSGTVQLKLDELIRSVQGAHNALLDVERLTEQDLDRLRLQFGELARLARADLRRGFSDTGTPDVAPESPTVSE